MWLNRTIWYNRPLDDGPKELCALWEPQSFESTSNGIDKAKSGSLEREIRIDLVVVHVVGNILENLVGFWSNGRFTTVG